MRVTGAGGGEMPGLKVARRKTPRRKLEVMQRRKQQPPERIRAKRLPTKSSQKPNRRVLQSIRLKLRLLQSLLRRPRRSRCRSFR